MTADGTYTAVLDRFEDGSGENRSARDGSGENGSGEDGSGETGSGEDRSRSKESGERAVLLLESGGEVVAERAIPTWRLPDEARRQDAVLDLSMKNGFVVSMEYDPEATERRSSGAQSRFDRLAKRPGEESESRSGDSDEPIEDDS